MGLTRQRIVAIIGKLCLLMMSLLVAWGIAEVVVYYQCREWLALFPRYVTDTTYGEFQIRRNIPNARYFHTSLDGQWEFRINGRGFRDDRGFPYGKPTEVVRVLTLGDSFTVGYEVQQDETYSAVLERLLESRGIKAEVINTGVSGFGNAEELVFLEQEGLKYHPDVVIVGFFANDFDDNVRSGLYGLGANGGLELRSKVYLPAIRARNLLNSFAAYRWLSEHSYVHNYLNTRATLAVKERVRRSNRAAIATTSNGPGKRDYERKLAAKILERIRDMCRKNGCRLIILDIASNVGGKVLPSLDLGGTPASSVCDIYLDSAAFLASHEGETALYQPHGHGHWTAFSHRLAAENLAPLVESIVAAPKEN